MPSFRASVLLVVLLHQTSCERSRSSVPATDTRPAIATKIVGSGATLPARLYQRWTETFTETTKGRVRIAYDATGSAAGVHAFLTAKTDFGATDTALTAEERSFAGSDVVELPVTGGLVVVAFNVPGVPQLRLSRQTVAKIFSAQITRWNDPEIVAANPQAALPDLPVTPVHRLDGSGTTHVFTHYLAQDNAWPKAIGFGRAVPWPAGVGAFGNEGMGVKIKHNEGAVGYVEYGVAKQVKLTMAALQTAAGFAEPSIAAGHAALMELAGGKSETTQSGPSQGYPLATLSWLLLHKRSADPTRLAAVANFVRYGLTTGQVDAEGLGYIPLPSEMVRKALADLEAIAPQGH